jgi:hypothetical protein
MKVTLLPIDDRPVTYLWPQILAHCAGVEAVVPPRSVLGGLTRAANMDELAAWLAQRSADTETDCALLCLDSLLYGGLITSRRSADSQEEIEKRLHQIFGKPDPKKKTEVFGGRPRAEVLAQASIMRISDNYDANEEKEYWQKYGREIYAWSEIMHRLSSDRGVANGQLEQYEAKIPADIRADYLKTRHRNFAINRQLLEFVPSHRIQRLVFSQDDSGAFGLNVLEKERLTKMAHSLKVQEQVISYPGADEVVDTLLAYALIRYAMRNGDRRAKCAVRFSSEEGPTQQSRYEGQTIQESITNQLKACGISVAPEGSDISDVDFVVLVHTSETVQGDQITLPGLTDLSRIPTKQSAQNAITILKELDRPFVICDVAFANGGDPLLVEALLEEKNLIPKLWSYAGWNTTGNTVGSALALAVSHWFAHNSGKDAQLAQVHKSALFTRLVDDYAYQSLVRKELGGKADPNELEKLLTPYAEKIAVALSYQPSNLAFSFPWQRTFEIEVKVDLPLNK